MEQIIKQCAGIDCAKKDFAVTFSVCDAMHETQHLSSRTFANDELGFKAFNKWLGKFYKRSMPMSFVMEATGVYHERLAYFLNDLGYQVVILLPKRAKDFSKTLKVKKITDKIASQYLAIMGLEKKLDVWNKPKKEYLAIRHLSREKDRIQHQISQLKNQLEAEMSGAHPGKKTIRRINETLKLLKKQKKKCLQKLNR
jgi:transposase